MRVILLETLRPCASGPSGPRRERANGAAGMPVRMKGFYSLSYESTGSRWGTCSLVGEGPHVFGDRFPQPGVQQRVVRYSKSLTESFREAVLFGAGVASDRAYHTDV